MSEEVISPIDNAFNEGASKLNAFLTSLIRTYAPKFVVAVIAWLAVALGFEVSAESTVAIVVVVVGLLEALWYFVARAFEQYGSKKGLSWLVKLGGVMLFVPKPPAYTPKQAAVLLVNSSNKE